MDEGGLAEEIELLEAIYVEELEVHKNEKNEVDKITLQLHPATGEDLDKRYVCMTLILDLATEYPDVPPDITIRNPRGIAEEEILSLREDMHKLCEDRKGGPVLYELIELAKDSLTAGNIPHCPCMICLEHFHEGDKFTKTECYHYFHESCLSRYVTHVLTQTPEIVPAHTMPSPAPNKLVCPVCREEIQYKFDDSVVSPVEDKFEFVPSPELREMQSRMASMFEEQKAKGGIIDIEAEKNKYLIKHGDVVLMPPPKRDSKKITNSDKQSSLQSLNEIDHQEIKKDNKPEETKKESQTKKDQRNFKSERNDKFRYNRSRGNRSYDSASPRDSDKRWKDNDDKRWNERRDKRMTERTSDTSHKDENRADNNEYDNVKDSRNKPNFENRGNRNRNKEKDKRLSEDRKDTFVKETDGDPRSEKHADKTEERSAQKERGFGRPKRKDVSENKGTDEENSSLDNENVVKDDSDTKVEKPDIDDKEIKKRVNDRRFQGGFGRPPSRGDNNEESERYRRNNQNTRRGGFGRPPRKDLKDENQFKENPNQSREHFERPDRYSKDNLQETSRPFSGKRNNTKATSRSSHRGLDDPSDSGVKQGTNNRGSYNDRNRESWKHHGRSNKSDEGVKYSDEDQSYSHNNDRRYQDKDRSGYYDRGRRGSGRGRGNSAYNQSRKQYENEYNKSKSYSRNKSPTGNQKVDKDTESVGLKLGEMVVSDKQYDHDDCRKGSSSKDCDKNYLNFEGSKSFPPAKVEGNDSKSNCLKGPPGFVTECPPGFESTEEKSKSAIKPPPGFSSEL